MGNYLFYQIVEKIQNKESVDKLIYGWELICYQKGSSQKLYVGSEKKGLEFHQEREVNETSYNLKIYVKKVDDEKSIGIGKIDLDVFSSFEEQIDLAVKMAKSSDNEYWKLLSPFSEKEYKKVVTADNKIMFDTEDILKKIKKRACRAILSLKDIFVNTAEIYVNRTWIKSLTSTGIETLEERSGIYFEIAMEKKGKDNDKEVNNMITSVSLKDLDVKKFIFDTAEETLNLVDTQEPLTDQNAIIIVDKEVVSSFMAALRCQMYSSVEYLGCPYFKVGDKVYEGEKTEDSTPINLAIDPFIPVMAESAEFTREGIPAKKAVVIKDGIVQEQIVSNRFGQYLNKKYNGIIGNMILDTGDVSYKDFNSMYDKVIEIICFSSLLINDQTLTWSSEIKFAKQYNKDGSVTYIKSGVVSGNIKENMSACILSKEKGVVSFPGNNFEEAKGYIGPEKMLIRQGVSVVGKLV